MRQAARLLDAATGGSTAGYAHGASRGREGGKEGNPKTEQHRSVEQARQKREEVEQAEDNEPAQHSERRPAGGPHSLPQQRSARESQPRCEWGVEVGRAVGHTPPRYHHDSQAILGSQSGMASRDSISS